MFLGQWFLRTDSFVCRDRGTENRFYRPSFAEIRRRVFFGTETEWRWRRKLETAAPIRVAANFPSRPPIPTCEVHERSFVSVHLI